MNQTTEQIIVSIQNLPALEQRRIWDWLNAHKPNSIGKAAQLTESKIAEMLLAQGVIKEIPSDWDKPETDFTPISIKGEPLSATILEDRE